MSDLILPVYFVMSLIAYNLIAKWYVMPRLIAMPRDRALIPLLLVHSFRFIGLSFLITGVTDQPLPEGFSHPAAYGDLVAAVLALAAIAALSNRWRIAIPLVWVFSLEGTIDLLYALFQGSTKIEWIGDMGATFFIPAVLVPMLLVTHFMIFKLLIAPKKS